MRSAAFAARSARAAHSAPRHVVALDGTAPTSISRTRNGTLLHSASLREVTVAKRSERRRQREQRMRRRILWFWLIALDRDGAASEDRTALRRMF